MTTELQKYRARAIKILLDKADKVVPMLIDYQLDDFLRSLLNLPVRPSGHSPYSGWLASNNLRPNKAVNQISHAGIDLIKRFEGCRLTAYQCPAKVWTIGYGHTKTCKPGQKINLIEAERLLRQDLIVFEAALNKLVTVPLSQNQYDALVSFVFNVGSTALARSTLLVLLNRHDYLGAAEQFLRWTKAGNVTLAGLVARRKAEYELFLS